MSDSRARRSRRFLRGDADVAEFEQWIYAHSDELESHLGERVALQLLATDYRSPEAVAGVKALLRAYAERASDLECLYEALLRLGLAAGTSVDFAEPEQANSLRWTITDLARARPGIRVSELAELLNLDIDTAHALARRAVRHDGVAIEFDRPGQ